MNIMLDRSGRIVVMDFGLAYPLDAEPITAAGAALGTLAYMSPEQNWSTKVHRKASTLETSRRCSWKRRFDPTTACK